MALCRFNPEEAEDAYVVHIADNGVGFCEAEAYKNNHVGISNSRSRLDLLCGGTLTVKSTEGKGTDCPRKNLNNAEWVAGDQWSPLLEN